MIFASLNSEARDQDLLKCLGSEEKAYHLKKETGPNYDLNQRLMAEVIQIPNAAVEPEALKDICQRENVAWKLLQLSIVRGKSLFQFPRGLGGMQKQMTMGMIDDYLEVTREILLSYIGQIQAESPTPTCLEEEIPALKPFLIDIKYLQEDVDVKQLFAKRDIKIFDQLKGYKEFFQRCRDRLKKKAKPVSTAEPKKP